MDDTPSSAWKAYGYAFIFLIAVAVLGVSCTTKARAQELLCADADVFIRQISELKKQRPVWEGVIPIEGGPPAEALILQSDKGEWSLFLIQSGRACLMAAGTDANPPINLGKGA